MNILVIDGQGGRIGRLFIEGLRQRSAEAHIICRREQRHRHGRHAQGRRRRGGNRRKPGGL